MTTTKKAAITTVLVVTLAVLPMLVGAAQTTHRVDDAHHGFGDVGQWSQMLEGPERDRWQKPEEVIKNLNLKPGDVIADIGAGTGYFTRRFALAVGPQGVVWHVEQAFHQRDFLASKMDLVGAGSQICHY